MTSSRKSWNQRLANDQGLPIVKPIPERLARTRGNGTMAIPSPRDVEEAIRLVPRRKVTTIERLARALAKKHRATVGCTVTTGIFAWIVANAAAEDERAGRGKIAPYWRVLKTGGELNAKYPGGIVNLTRRLSSEGHVVVKKGQRFFVREYDKRFAPER